jgi:hypothetical protein
MKFLFNNILIKIDFQVPPYMLTERNVSLCRTEQQPGQFVVVFPRAYTSSVCTGYTISESVYFATNSWLDTAHLDFKVKINLSLIKKLLLNFLIFYRIFKKAASQQCSH